MLRHLLLLLAELGRRIAKCAAGGQSILGSDSLRLLRLELLLLVEHGLRGNGLCRDGLGCNRLRLYDGSRGGRNVLGPRFTAPPPKLRGIIRVGVPPRRGGAARA